MAIAHEGSPYLAHSTGNSSPGPRSRLVLGPPVHELSEIDEPVVIRIDVFETEDQGFSINEVNYTMEFRNSIAPTGVNIPDRMIDFCLKVANDGWASANGWKNGEHEHGYVTLTA